MNILLIHVFGWLHLYAICALFLFYSTSRMRPVAFVEFFLITKSCFQV